MANIVIKELDLTTPSVTNSNNEVVYVPGFATNDEGAYPDYSNRALRFTPTLCSTIAEFNYYFGNYPAVFTEDFDWSSYSSDENIQGQGNLFMKNTVDPSYMYAKELINAGITVLYEKMNDDSSSEYKAEDMYSALKGGSTSNDENSEYYYDPYTNLADIGEYSVKYITSGGYPTFESGDSIKATAEMVAGETKLGNSITISTDFYSTYTGEPGDYVVDYQSYDADWEAEITGGTVDTATFVDVPSISSALVDGATYTFTRKEVESVVTWDATGAVTISDISDSDLTSVYGITPEENVSTITLTLSNTAENVSGWYLEAYDSVSPEFTFIGNINSNGDIVKTVIRADSQVGEINSGINVQGTIIPDDTYKINITLESNVSTSLVGKMMFVAASRGDAVALIDHTNNMDRPLTGVNSVYYSVSEAISPYRINSNNEYGAMFTPWFVYTPVLSYSSANRKYNSVKSWIPSAMPGSFAYLISLASSVRDNPSWLAIAGVARGVVPNLTGLSITRRLTNAIADNIYQPDNAIAINPITNIRPYGYTIWGNRTLKDNAKKNGLTATSFLNIRNMLSDIKKQAYNAAVIGLFEQNSDILWLNFKSQIEPLLDRMTSGYGITDYSIVREPSNSPAKVVATIRIYPVYAVEMFEITVELSNSTIEVAE